jgi:hypothetical protein
MSYPVGIEAMMFWENVYGDITDPPTRFGRPGLGVARKIGR